MTDPATVLDLLGSDLISLDQFGKDLDTATQELNLAEAEWEEVYDRVAEDLRDEYAREGRKSDPAEHTITATCRRQHRATYRRWREAKRDLERLERQLQKQRALTNGRQSELAALRDELKAGDHAQRGPANPQVIGRAA